MTAPAPIEAMTSIDAEAAARARVGLALDLLAPADLADLDSAAAFMTRKDRKYLVTAEQLALLLSELPSTAQALEIDGRRWFRYRSVYFDTDDLVSFRQAAMRRPRRFKVRTRTYVDANRSMLEVKRKSRRGKTVKKRIGHDADDRHLGGVDYNYLGTFDEVARHRFDLVPTLETSYRRATLLLADEPARITIDASLSAVDDRGSMVDLPHHFIVETKGAGKPTSVDQWLWAHGLRPVKFSKYATCLAATRGTLRANRWRPVLERGVLRRL